MAYFRNNPGRFSMLHVKDRAADGAMADVGRGTLDFAEIFALASVAGFEHYFIEHDNPSDGINSIAYSYNTVNQIRF
jgi:sugar phosphate isomerase/epimerase